MAETTGTHTLAATFTDPAGHSYTATFSGTGDNWTHAMRCIQMIASGSLYGNLIAPSVSAVPGLSLMVGDKR